MIGLVVLGGLLVATIGYSIALTTAKKGYGIKGMAVFSFVVVLALWGLQAISISRLPNCSLSGTEWLKGVMLFRPDCAINAGNVELGQFMGFAFRKFFAVTIAILSLPAFLLAYRDSRN